MIWYSSYEVLGGSSWLRLRSTKKLEFYKVKDIYLGYITTIHPEALKLEDRFQNDVIALKKKKNEKGAYIYSQISESPKYYVNIKKVSLSSILNRGGFITNDRVLKLVEQEKQKEKSRMEREILIQLEEENKTNKRQDITLIERELDINKAKQLVA